MSEKDIGKFVGEYTASTLADMQRMLSDGSIPNVNVMYSGRGGWTALMRQVNSGTKEAMEWLLGRNADPNIQNSNGATALMFAVLINDPEKVRLLLENGADRNIANNKGDTPIQNARKNNTKPEIIAALDSYYPAKKSSAANVNVRVNAKKISQTDIMEKFVGTCHESQRKKEYTSLPKLADMRKMLSEDRTLDVNTKNTKFFDMTALMVQANCGSIEAMGWLLEETGAVTNLQNSRGDTALHFAVASEDPRKVDLLLQFNADIGIVNSNGKTPIDVLSRERISNSNRAETIIGMLLTHQRHIDEFVGRKSQDKRDDNVPESAPTLNNMKRVFPFVNNVNVRNSKSDNETALIHQAGSGTTEAMMWLLTRAPPADPNIRDINGKTALMTATANNDLEKIRLLLEYGADRNITDVDGDTPLQVARNENKNQEVIEVLESYFPEKKITFQTAEEKNAYIKREKKQLEIEELLNRYKKFIGELPTSPPSIEEMQRMLDSKAVPNVNVRNEKWNNTTALMWQAAHGTIEAMEWLLTHGADPDLIDSYSGYTALHHVVDNDESDNMSVEKVNLLLRYGANKNIGVKGVTPLTLAMEKNNKPKVISVLRPNLPPPIETDTPPVTPPDSPRDLSEDSPRDSPRDLPGPRMNVPVNVVDAARGNNVINAANEQPRQPGCIGRYCQRLNRVFGIGAGKKTKKRNQINKRNQIKKRKQTKKTN